MHMLHIRGHMRMSINEAAGWLWQVPCERVDGVVRVSE